MKTRIILVGGFLGAGKTTLLAESARKINENGRKVGLITNDQASELVDTAFLECENGTVLEVSGSCFCCNFNGFSDAITQAAIDKQCEIIIAEPVGSCTDLSATILQPLKDKFKDSLIVAPLTVVVDPERLADILYGGTSGLHGSAAYIFCKQLEEADIILINKSDLLPQDVLKALMQRTSQEWPLAHVLSISANSGEGVEEWLEEVLHRIDSGTHLAEVDYDIYAEGEAVLGWLNASFNIEGNEVDRDKLLYTLIHSLSRRFDQIEAPVGHVKLLMEADGQYVIGNLTGKSDSISIRGRIGLGNKAKLTLNARVQMSPQELERIVSEELSRVLGDIKIQFKLINSNCLSPGRPDPTYHYDNVI